MATAYRTSTSAVADSPGFPTFSQPERILTVAGLVIGFVLGFGSNFAPAGPAQYTAQAISSIGLILATAVLTLRFAREGRDIVAIGFALMTLAETVILSAGTPADPGAEGTFASGVALYALALPLISIPAAFPIWTRVLGILAAVPFAAHEMTRLLGGSASPAGPLAGTGYALLTLTLIGWTIAILRATPTEGA